MKEKKFDFEEACQQITESAKKCGMEDDVVFQTLFKEFKRIKNVCDELYKSIEARGVAYYEEGTKGQQIYRSNPSTKEYVTAHKTLVSTCSALRDILPDTENDEDFTM